MKILFIMRNTMYVRNLEATLRLLAERGHEVHVIADAHFLSDSNQLIERLCRDHTQIRHSAAPAIPFSHWSFLGLQLRRAVDYLRYLGPEFADAPKLRRRADRNAPEFIVSALQQPLLASSIGRSLLERTLRWCDRAVPRDPAVDAFIRGHDPDLVLVTPLVEPGSPQAEYLRSARALGIRTGLCVYSWDNLTNKGLIQDPLDIVTVWNEPMKEEAVTLHDVPADRVVVTGAVAYDHWFTWRPRRSREAFAERVGLAADRPYLLYLCSSKFIAPNEAEFIRRWITELRTTSGVLRGVGVLVRPHPQNAEQWESADLSDLPDVGIWPRAGAIPVDEESRADYYDSIYHSAAVVGVNTSAQIESAIVGRGVYTVLADEFRETQEGTLHFRHLRDLNGGLLHVAPSFSEHIAQLEAAVRGGNDDAGRCRRFVEVFVRPHGIGEAATPRLAAALEATAARGRKRRERGPWWAPLVRPALARAAARLAGSPSARKEKQARGERVREQQKAERIAQRAAARAAKQQAEAEGALRKQEEDARLADERRAAEMVAAKAYEDYLCVRERVRRMSGRPDRATVVLTDAEQQAVRALAHLWDATPATIARLRQWCEPISGVRASDYDVAASAMTLGLKRELWMLRREGVGELFVQEPPVLGGFGFNRRGEQYNEDTMKFFNALVALQDGAVLAPCREAAGRRLVWEIGGGWGGFAYQFKTLCPNVTYLITGMPDLFLVSAVYLMTVFPGARFRFYGESSTDDFWHGWEDVDFLFAPEAALPALRPPPIDLTLDIMALPMMGSSRVQCHVQRAFDFGARYFYSLLPGSSVGNGRPVVWNSIERLYWPHPVPARGTNQSAADAESRLVPYSDYAHLVGWRRMRV
jgi:hypothetical protein